VIVLEMPGGSNPLREAIKRLVVNPALETRVHGTAGRVVAINKENNRAIVEFYVNGAKVVRHNVPISKNSSMVDSKKIKDEEYVWISFVGGSLQDPVIVSKFEPYYNWEKDVNEYAQYLDYQTEF
jgi:hypothetical protein